MERFGSELRMKIINDIYNKKIKGKEYQILVVLLEIALFITDIKQNRIMLAICWLICIIFEVMKLIFENNKEIGGNKKC